MLAHFFQASGYSAHSHEMVVAFVSALLLRCSPLAIFLTVVTASFYAIQCSSCWPCSHIFQKVFKLNPPFTYSNASTSVTSIRFAFGIPASAQHCNPTSVSWASRHAVSSECVCDNFSVVFCSWICSFIFRHNFAFDNVVFSSVAGLASGVHCDFFNICEL